MDYNLILNDADMRVIDEALGNMPYKMAAPLINKINEQIINRNKKEKDKEE